MILPMNGSYRAVVRVGPNQRRSAREPHGGLPAGSKSNGRCEQHPHADQGSWQSYVSRQVSRRPGWEALKGDSTKGRRETRRNGKGVGGRRAYSSSSVELSPDPPDPSPSFESTGFLMTLFWTTGGGPVELPSGGGGPRALVLRAGAPATTAPPLGGRWSRMRDPHL